MTLTTAEQVRLRIQDIPQRRDLVMYGDGLRSAYAVTNGNAQVTNLVSATAFIAGANAWTSTGATFDATGFVTFSGVISANTAFRVVGVESIFSDAEIGHFTAVGGSVNGAALEAVKTLRFDALKRAKWAAPDGASYDDTAAIAALQKLYDDLRTELAEGDIDGTDFVSWALEQDWSW